MVLFVMIDGLRPDAITADGAPALTGLMARGAYSLAARSVMPCITLPCHMSIFHSVPPTRHGVTTNVWSPMARPLPGLMEAAKAAGKRCAFFINWEPLRNLSQPESLEFSYFRNNVKSPGGDYVIAAEAMRVLPAESFDFAFVYLGTVDEAGHDYGWMSPNYLAQVTAVDEALGLLLSALPASTAVVVQADHGGHDRSHGTEAVEDMTIPWIAAGPGLRAGHALQGPVSLLDTAPTLARLMGVPPAADWEGRVVAEAFE
jgi:predicted AlkP superfamily pyrophosphatase or phosphodiesterase